MWKRWLPSQGEIRALYCYQLKWSATAITEPLPLLYGALEAPSEILCCCCSTLSFGASGMSWSAGILRSRSSSLFLLRASGSEIYGVSKAVLPKFFLDDLHSECFDALMSCSKRHVVTSFPRIMVEYSLKEHAGVNDVFGTELQVNARGYCTGLVETLMLGHSKAEAVKKVFGEEGPFLPLLSSTTTCTAFMRGSSQIRAMGHDNLSLSSVDTQCLSRC